MDELRHSAPMVRCIVNAEPEPLALELGRTEVCVHTTVREANDRGYRCVVPSDCCASYSRNFTTSRCA